ncbi:MAG: hypothetical protein ABI409_03610 [Ramlibacter sp.]
MHPDRSGAVHGNHAWRGWSLALALALTMAFALCGCAAPATALPEPPVPIVASAAPSEAAPAAVPARPAEPAAQAAVVDTVLGFADRVRGMPSAELAQEINRLGDGSDSAVRSMQLAIALAQSKVPANTVRAQALLQRVLGQNEPDARALHPLARLIAPQLAESRRADEQIERQAQQLRDAQRRIDVLNERLEAVRTIERSLPSVPASGASSPAPARP